MVIDNNGEKKDLLLIIIVINTDHCTEYLKPCCGLLIFIITEYNVLINFYEKTYRLTFLKDLSLLEH